MVHKTRLCKKERDRDMKSRKGKVIFTAFIATALVVGTSLGVNAYFTSNDKASVNVKVVKIDTEIDEDFNTDGVKEVKIQNKGTADCYVRARIVTSPENVLAAVSLTGTEDGWEYGDDGYYYYTRVLEAPEDENHPTKTTALTKSYEIDTDRLVELGYDDISFEISVYEESVQANLADELKEDALEKVKECFQSYNAQTMQ